MYRGFHRSLLAAIAVVAVTSGSAAAAEYVFVQSATPTASLAPPKEKLATLPLHGLTVVEDYGIYVLSSYDPPADLPALSRLTGLTLVPAIGFNSLLVGGVDIDTTTSSALTPSIPSALRLADYPAGGPGLYLLQLIGLPKDVWLAGLKASGFTLVQYIEHNGYIVKAKAGLAALKAALPRYVKFIAPLEPFGKMPAELRNRISDQPLGVSVLLDTTDKGDDPTSRVLRLDRNAHVAAIRDGEAIVSLNATRDQYTALAFDPGVIWIEPNQNGFPSDERADQISVGHYSGNGATQPGQYQAFLSSSCASCVDMAAERIDVVDTGLTLGPAHPDLNGGTHGARLIANSNFLGTTGAEDRFYHGTFVTGLMAGNPTQTGGTNNSGDGGFFWGMGLAPTVSFLNTRIFDDFGRFVQIPTAPDIGPITANAFNFGATAQNNSWNLCGDTYSLVSREYDLRVRDAIVSLPGQEQRRPLTIVFAAGNHPTPGCGGADPVVRDPAIAKNVLSVGASAFARDALQGSCTTTSGIRDVASFSRRGIQSGPGRFKPDILAPGQSSTSTRSNVQYGTYDCGGSNTIPAGGTGPYYAGNGTSFAAPLVTAASVLVKRKVGGTPSPALTKAILVGTTETMNGGIDRMTGYALGWEPTPIQGWGRLSLQKLLSDSTPATLIEEDADTNPNRRFTATGQTWNRTLTRADQSKDVIIVLAYTDYPSAGGSAGNAVNQLHLRASDGWYTSWNEGTTGTYYTPPCTWWCWYCAACSQNDPVNTVKRIVIPSSTVFTSLIIYVDAYSISQKAVPYLDPGASVNQDWAIYVYNAY